MREGERNATHYPLSFLFKERISGMLKFWKLQLASYSGTLTVLYGTCVRSTISKKFCHWSHTQIPTHNYYCCTIILYSNCVIFENNHNWITNWKAPLHNIKTHYNGIWLFKIISAYSMWLTFDSHCS